MGYLWGDRSRVWPYWREREMRERGEDQKKIREKLMGIRGRGLLRQNTELVTLCVCLVKEGLVLLGKNGQEKNV